MIEITPASERPRERCLETGPDSLSLRECLALILSSGPKGVGCLGLAQQILEKPGSGFDPTELEKAFFTSMEASGQTHLQGLPGLGPAGRAKILAAFELGRKYVNFRSSQSQESSSRQNLNHLAKSAIHKIPARYRTAAQEWLGFIPVHRTRRLGEFCLVEKGARTHVNIDPAELFARILALRPLGFYLFHNHPSGNLDASVADYELTQNVAEVSAQLSLKFLGHWIITAHSQIQISDELERHSGAGVEDH